MTANANDIQAKRISYTALKDEIDTLVVTDVPEQSPFIRQLHAFDLNGLDQRDGGLASPPPTGSVRLKVAHFPRPSITTENEAAPSSSPHRARSKSDAAASYASDRSKTSKADDHELETIERDRKSSNAGSNANSNDSPDDAAQSEINIRGNLYQTKKTVAQGLLDIALLTANGSQMKNLIETENHPFYTVAMVLLSTSIVLQIVIAIVLLVVGRMDLETSKKQRKKDDKKIVFFNDVAIIGVFLITAVNIFIGIFISHGKAYIPPVDAAASWNQRMFERQKQIWEPVRNTSSPAS